MATQCTSDAFPLAGLGRRHVVGKFDGGRLSSDGGAVLLRAANQAFQVTGRLAACFIDYRNPARVEHSLESLLGQRVFALALGYEDINDHDRLRDDSWLARARSTGWSWVRRWRQTRTATRRSWRARNRSTTCWWICSWTCTRRSRSGSCGASGSAGRRQRSWCAGTPVFAGTRS